ncbi:hypothetical protein, partial [Streptomyces parvus]|uniref:hypothetical protein n=1 Tax=Streptomyces parvus TaxID=66428 RepID=UPI003684A08C
MSTTSTTTAADPNLIGTAAHKALTGVPTAREVAAKHRLASAEERVRLTLETSTAIQTAQHDAETARREAAEARTEAQRAELAAEAALSEAERAARAVEEVQAGAEALREELAAEREVRR